MQRLFDLFFSTLAIIILSPLLIPIIIILKFTGEHYIFYAQERMGKGNKSFKVLKFATMLKDSPNMAGANVTKKNDPRVLPFGKILRKTKINELPQLFNIWLGHMSVVGPRPLTVDQYNNYNLEQRDKISRVTPGLTGIGSLIFRDEEAIMERSGMDYNEIHDTIIANYKGELEIWYFENKNIILYFKIIILTAFAVIKSDFDARSSFKDLPIAEEKLEKLF